MTLATQFMSTLPKNFNWESIYMGSFLNNLVCLYIENDCPTEPPPTIAFYPGHHHCIELYDGSALAFATNTVLDTPDCKVYWIKPFASYSDAKNYVAPLAGASHNDNVREFFTQTKH